MTDLRALLGDERFSAAMYDLSLTSSVRGLERRSLKLYADGWMAAMDVLLPDLLAAAWDEGHHAGHEDARAVQPTYPEPTPNPYRAEESA